MVDIENDASMVTISDVHAEDESAPLDVIVPTNTTAIEQLQPVTETELEQLSTTTDATTSAITPTAIRSIRVHYLAYDETFDEEFPIDSDLYRPMTALELVKARRMHAKDIRSKEQLEEQAERLAQPWKPVPEPEPEPAVELPVELHKGMLILRGTFTLTCLSLLP